MQKPYTAAEPGSLSRIQELAGEICHGCPNSFGALIRVKVSLTDIEVSPAFSLVAEGGTKDRHKLHGSLEIADHVSPRDLSDAIGDGIMPHIRGGPMTVLRRVRVPLCLIITPDGSLVFSERNVLALNMPSRGSDPSLPAAVRRAVSLILERSHSAHHYINRQRHLSRLSSSVDQILKAAPVEFAPDDWRMLMP